MGTRYVHYQMAMRDSTLALTYVNTKENVFADNLSRDCNATVQFLLTKGFQRIFISENHLLVSSWLSISDLFSEQDAFKDSA